MSHRTQSAPAAVRNSSFEIRALPELLAPAGDWDCARAAVENGADAIYFGLDKLNARIRASNFTEADLPKLMEFLHRRGVKGYVTLNTLVFENELAEAEQYLRTMIAAGVDAVIVQDVGICRLIRELSPDFPIHASTQMTITSAGGVEFARELGCSLVVLARECSIKEIERIQEALAGRASSRADAAQPAVEESARVDARPTVLPLEVFVHGALCVAYSGQCLTSEALGGRSANRGECAQACRMPYELISDGRMVPLGDRKYLLSPRDLSGLEVLPDLIRAGVASLKIEGRLKTPEYVANITRIYRQALDNLVGTRCCASQTDQKEDARQRVSTESRYAMEMAFSRGLHTGWLRGTNNQQLVHGRFGKKRGVYLGAVARMRRDGVVIRLEGPLKPGDGVVFDAGKPEEKEEGGRVYEVRGVKCEGRGATGEMAARDARHASRLTHHDGSNPQAVELRFGRGDIDFSRIHIGDKVWKTSDPELDRRLRRSFAGDTPRFQRPLSMEVHGAAGQPLTLLARDELGNVARADSAVALAKAERQPLTAGRLREQLGRLGGTPFKLGGLKSFLTGEILLPVSELNRLRRQAVTELERLRLQSTRWGLNTVAQASSLRIHEASPPRQGAARMPVEPASRDACATLIVLVRNLAQLQAALESGVQTIYCDFDNPKKYRDAVMHFHTSYRAEGRAGSPLPAAFRNEDGAQGTARPTIWIAPPRIFKTGEEWTLQQVRSCEADGYLVRNYDHLTFFAKDRCIGDYSLNVANRLAADYFKNKFSLERLTASYDLNFQQLEALLRAAPPAWFEVTLHQHMPMFHMEHCIFCAFLSSGTDYTNCGRPCDRHQVKLRDRVGADHPVKADVGCRNTVFNALSQTGAEYASKMLALGVRHFRVEFLNEPPEMVRQTILKYRRLLRGEITGTQLWRESKLFNQLGVTRGQMGGQRP
jgi:putative protease